MGSMHMCRHYVRIDLRSIHYVVRLTDRPSALVAATSSGEKKARVTSHPSVKDAIVAKGWEYSEERVVVDGNVITSRG